MGEFKEKYNIVVDTFSTGSSSVKYTKYYDMQNYKSCEFLVSGLVKLDATGALGATDYQLLSLAAYQATSATGGGASAISSATAIIGKDSGTGISTAAKCRVGRINFATMDKATALTINVGTAAYVTSSAATTANLFVVKGASDNATVAAQAFMTMFNNASQNTSTAITANWVASTDAAGVAWVKITPRDPDGTHLLRLGVSGSSFIGVGGVFNAHISVDRQFMTKRYIALSVTTTEHGNPYVVTVLREAINKPTTSVAITHKSLSGSTTK